ncbi:hypothetical protein [Streptomyces canus]|uniref:hypothetical protein n=1 Tax=Streptomyces canus TaxID=58343 RepID=UPI003722CF1C
MVSGTTTPMAIAAGISTTAAPATTATRPWSSALSRTPRTSRLALTRLEGPGHPTLPDLTAPAHEILAAG